MNREIKFRCWIPERVFSESIKQDAYMAAQGDPDLETLSSFIHHYGDEPTLMQFTGLKDKNGKDIYEGDIIRSESKIVTIQDNKDTGKTSVKFYRIGWHKSGCWHRYTGLTDDVIGITGITISNLRFYEVIGNIYENPELLNP